MADLIEIPNINAGVLEKIPNAPGWLRVSQSGNDGRDLKPVIRCNCGEIMGIGDHHVHPDGRVTASFYDRDGCGWHVFLKLLDYALGDFPPDAKPMRKAASDHDEQKETT